MSDRETDGTEINDLLWYESLSDDQSWVSLWSVYMRCVCGGIRSTEAQCPVCGEDLPNLDWEVVRDTDGNEYRVPPTFMGAEGRFEDWIYLRMLEREWLRPVEAELYDSIPVDHRPFRASDCRAGVLELLRDAYRKAVSGNGGGGAEEGDGPPSGSLFLRQCADGQAL